jgi:tetratricopeptide (TPR) repeat protein
LLSQIYSFFNGLPLQNIIVLIAITIFVWQPLNGIGQISKIDSLEQLLAQSPTDSMEVALMAALSKAYWYVSPEKSLQIANEAKKKAEKLQNEPLIALTINNLAGAYWTMGSYEEALIAYLQVLLIRERLQDEIGIAMVKNNIGKVFEKFGDYEKALSYLEGARPVFEERKMSEQLGIIIANIGYSKTKLKRHKEAIADFECALRYASQVSDYHQIGSIYNYLGNVYHTLSQDAKALDYYQKALVTFSKIQDQWSKVTVLLGIAENQFSGKQVEQAIQTGLEAYRIANNLKAKDRIKEAAQFLSKAYGANQDFTNAFQYQSIYVNYRDSLLSESTYRRNTALLYNYELNKKESENLSLRAEKKEREIALSYSESVVARQQIWIATIVVFLLFSLTLVVIIYRLYRKSRKSQIALETLNTEIVRQKEKISLQANLLQYSHQQIETANKNLESLVEERTLALQQQNQQLVNYAFFNAHRVRGPLTRILGLVYLIRKDSPHEVPYLNMLDEAAHNLHEVTEEINKILDDEQVFKPRIKEDKSTSTPENNKGA